MRWYQSLQRKKIFGWSGILCFLILFVIGTGLLWKPERSREFLSRWKWFVSIQNLRLLGGTGVLHVDVLIVALPLIAMSAIPLFTVRRRSLEEAVDTTSRDWPLCPSPEAQDGEIKESSQGGAQRPSTEITGRTRGNLGPFFLSMGLILFAYQMGDMAKNRYRPLDFYLWIVAILSMILGTVLWDRAQRVRFRSPIRLREWIWLAALTVAVFYLYSWDLESWRYTVVADQGSFFHYAKSIIEGKMEQSPFAQDGVYETFPALSSHYQSWVMRIGGVDRVGWLYSSCLATALTVIPVYIFARCLFTPGIAFLTSCIVGVNPFQIAFAHLGYNNAQCLLPVFASLAFLVWALRVGSRFGFFASGLSAGLGFYAFQTARLGIVFAGAMLLLYVFKGFRMKRISLALFFGFGLAVALLPTDLGINDSAKSHTVLRRYMELKGIRGTDFPAWSEALKDPLMRDILKRNAFQTVFLPIAYRARTHFVWGTLMDALTGPLSIVGFIYVLGWCWKRDRYCLLLFFLAAGLFGIGMFHSYEDIPATRVQFVVPFVAFFAAFSAEKFLLSLKSLASIRVDWPLWGLRGALVAGVAVLCMHRIYVVAPNKERAYDCALTWRAALETGRRVPIYWVIPDDKEPDNSLDFYRSPNPVKIFKNSRREEVLTESNALPRFLVVTGPENEGWDEWVKVLTEKRPEGWTRTFYDGSHTNSLRVFGYGLVPELGEWKPEE